jgi:hypothetical protein
VISHSYTVEPADIEHAKQEVHRLELIWRQHGAASPDKNALEEQGRLLTELARQIDVQDANLKSLRQRSQKQELEIRRLTMWLRCLRFWQASYTPTVICLAGMIGTVLFGVNAAIIVRPALGALVCLIGLCMTALLLVLQYYRVELGLDAGPHLEYLNARLESAKKDLMCLQSELQHSTATASRNLQEWKSDTARYDRLCSLRDLACRHEEAVKRYEGLLEIVNSRRYRLLHSDWRSMRSTVFESFLQEVFEMHGYAVQTTKASGDQGIDLILVGNGRRIGLQAKGYADSVGNHAVMEANAGKGYYHCDSCVVITNSDFTRAARELAAELNCRLIAGIDIPDLINGSIRL